MLSWPEKLVPISFPLGRGVETQEAEMSVTLLHWHCSSVGTRGCLGNHLHGKESTLHSFSYQKAPGWLEICTEWLDWTIYFQS